MYNVFVLTDDVSEEPEVLGLPSIDSVYLIKNVNNHKSIYHKRQLPNHSKKVFNVNVQATQVLMPS